MVPVLKYYYCDTLDEINARIADDSKKMDGRIPRILKTEHHYYRELRKTSVSADVSWEQPNPAKEIVDSLIELLDHLKGGFELYQDPKTGNWKIV